MNARVFLLVLVTAAFMAVWDADRPAELRKVVALSNDTTATASVNNAASDKTAAVEIATTNTASTQNDSVSHALAHDDKLIPFPKSLQTGTWHAFNHEGDTIRITIERSSVQPRSPINDLTDSTESSPDTCVITGSDGVRWCFVKEQTATAN